MVSRAGSDFEAPPAHSWELSLRGDGLMRGESDSEKWQWFRSGEGVLALEVEWIERAARTWGGRSEKFLTALKGVLSGGE